MYVVKFEVSELIFFVDNSYELYIIKILKLRTNLILSKHYFSKDGVDLMTYFITILNLKLTEYYVHRHIPIYYLQAVNEFKL